MSEIELRERIAAIALQVADLHGVSLADVIGKGRAPEVQWPRHEAAYVCQQLTSAPYAVIGAVLGGRDATTIKHSLQRVTGRAQADADYRVSLAQMLAGIDAAPNTALRARAVLQTQARADARLSASLLAACSVLSDAQLTDAEARRAALIIMTHAVPNSPTHEGALQ